MNINAVTKSSASKPEAINQNCSTVCSVCEGIGEEGHPRSKTYLDYSFPYIYLHYPDPGFLRCSYERYGCQVCRLILSYIQDESEGSPTSHGEQAQDYWEKLETFDLAQDTNEAASLVRSAYAADYSHELHIEGCGSGRVALVIERPDDSGPREYNSQSYTVKIHVFYDTGSVAPQLPKDLQINCSPGSQPILSHACFPKLTRLNDVQLI